MRKQLDRKCLNNYSYDASMSNFNKERKKYLHTRYIYFSSKEKEKLLTNINAISIYNAKIHFYRSTVASVKKLTKWRAVF